jgi:hypothetical protein
MKNIAPPPSCEITNEFVAEPFMVFPPDAKTVMLFAEALFASSEM